MIPWIDANCDASLPVCLSCLKGWKRRKEMKISRTKCWAGAGKPLKGMEPPAGQGFKSFVPLQMSDCQIKSWMDYCLYLAGRTPGPYTACHPCNVTQGDQTKTSISSSQVTSHIQHMHIYMLMLFLRMRCLWKQCQGKLITSMTGE